MDKKQIQTLSGGTMTDVTRIGNVIHRNTGIWTPQVQKLLAFLRGRGISEVPEPLGYDLQGREMLSYIPGNAAIALSEELRGDEVLLQAARLLRRIHDATVGIVQEWNNGWQFLAREPVEVICHGDFAPYNLLFQGRNLTGVIDWDCAHPGPRMWDIAYAVYRFAPLTAPSNPENFGDLQNQCARTQMFCNAYGVDDRSGLLGAVMERLSDLASMLCEGAGSGDIRFQANIDAGHLAIYKADLTYLEEHQNEYNQVLKF